MKTGPNTGRIAGLLLLVVFALGVINFQFLQASVLSGVEQFADVAASSNLIVGSALAGIVSGSVSIVVAVIMLPLFRRSSEGLAYAYLAFSIVNFGAIAIDTVSVMSVLEMSRAFASDAGLVARQASDGLVALLYGRHWWTHHLYLLTSCLPVVVFFSGLYVSRGVPRALSLFGVIATVVMAVGVIGAMAGRGLGEMMLIPIALVQVVTPLWLMARGLNEAE